MKPIKAKPKSNKQAIDEINPEVYIDPKEFEPIVIESGKKDLILERGSLEKFAEEISKLKESGKTPSEILSIIKDTKPNNADLQLSLDSIENILDEEQKNIKPKSNLRLFWERLMKLLLKPINRPSKLDEEDDKNSLIKKRQELEALIVKISSLNQEQEKPNDNSLTSDDKEPYNYMI